MKLNSIVPWGRSLAEYRAMFMLTDEDLEKSILGCSDGPASFNAELTELGGEVVSVDPVYQFSRDEIAHRIDEVAGEVLSEVEKHHDNYIWTQIPSVEALAITRMGTMSTFLKDYETGCRHGRYLNASLPQLPFAEGEFDLALCSHFLFLYSDHLDCDFHFTALKELGRIAREIRIYPLVTLDGSPSPHLPKILALLENESWQFTRQSVDYRFQKGADDMLVISTTEGI